MLEHRPVRRLLRQRRGRPPRRPRLRAPGRDDQPIRADRSVSLTGTEAGLTLYLPFSEGSGATTTATNGITGTLRSLADGLDGVVQGRIGQAGARDIYTFTLDQPRKLYLDSLVDSNINWTLRGPRGGCILSKAEYAAAIDKAVFPGWQGGPLEHVIAGKAVAFHEALQPEFKQYAQQIVKNASALAEALVAQGFRLVSGGTDIHMMVVDLRPFDADLTGKEAQAVLDEGGITLNKNTIPDDPRSPFVTSGVRIGTPSVTTQGMKEPEMVQIAELTARILRHRNDPTEVAAAKADVAALCARFPAYA